jgi:murein DD-endopeptidase MepM/ murein hydrolase activator NlpD
MWGVEVRPMLSIQRNRLWSQIQSERLVRLGAWGSCLALSILAAGCSADVTRLDGPAFNLSDKGGSSAAPRPIEPMSRRNAGAPMDGGSWPASGPRDADPVTRSALPPPPSSNYATSSNSAANAPAQKFASLPEPTPAPSTMRPYAAPMAQATISARPTPVRTAALSPQPTATGETIEVAQGDSLYGLSKRHGVSLAALMEVNSLTSPNLKPGQKLVLPLVSGAKKPKAREAAPVAAVGVPAGRPNAKVAAPAPAQAVTAAPAAAASDWTGSYTVKSGDSLFAVAKTHKVQPMELQRVNGITDPTKVRPGVVLKVPGSGSGAVEPAAPASIARTTVAAPTVAQAPLTSAPLATAPVAQGTGTAASPKIIGGGTPSPAEQKVAALNGTATDAAPTDAAPAPQSLAKPVAVKTAAIVPVALSAGASAGKFRWPVKGKVISEFGKRTDGTHNDGINVAVPAGTDIQAAESGTVAYAGSELKGYGNLILVRHENGWVSAYAHSDTVLVKRGDAIKRGQVIAKAGKTGTVDQPQVHFELRQGSKPVDPLPHMDKQ